MGPSVEGMLTSGSNSSAPFNKMVPCPYMGKNSFETESWYTASGTHGLPSLLK